MNILGLVIYFFVKLKKKFSYLRKNVYRIFGSKKYEKHFFVILLQLKFIFRFYEKVDDMPFSRNFPILDFRLKF